LSIKKFIYQFRIVGYLLTETDFFLVTKNADRKVNIVDFYKTQNISLTNAEVVNLKSTDFEINSMAGRR
jgi:hypothetical protein